MEREPLQTDHHKRGTCSGVSIRVLQCAKPRQFHGPECEYRLTQLRYRDADSPTANHTARVEIRVLNQTARFWSKRDSIARAAVHQTSASRIGWLPDSVPYG